MLSLLHEHYIQSYVKRNPSGLAIVPVLNLLQVELCWSMISATIPNLKSFIRSFNSGFGLGLDMDMVTAVQAYGKGSSRRGDTNYELSQLKSGGRSKDRSHTETETDEIEALNAPRSKSAAESRDVEQSSKQSIGIREDDSIVSIGSQEQIIRKDVHWQITYEPGQAL